MSDIDDIGTSTKESELSLFEIESVNDKSSESGSSGSSTAAAPQKLESELVSVDVHHEQEEKPKKPGIQQRGRFKVTTSNENVELDKVMSNQPCILIFYKSVSFHLLKIKISQLFIFFFRATIIYFKRASACK